MGARVVRALFIREMSNRMEWNQQRGNDMFGCRVEGRQGRSKTNELIALLPFIPVRVSSIFLMERRTPPIVEA
jgi:hypothetical protein